jgi:HSP20 family protein
MALIRFENFEPVANMLRLQQELDRYLRNPAFHLGVSGSGAFPPVNIFDDGEGTVVFAELPGIDPASLRISGQNKTLTLSGERKREEAGAPTRGHHRRERPFGEFSRSIQLPENLDMSKAAAKYENGILRIRIPKAESARPRQIQVEAE